MGMAKLVRALNPRRSASAPHRLVLVVSSVTAAAGVTLSQVLIRRRSAERASEYPQPRVIGPRRGAAHEIRLLGTGRPDDPPPDPAADAQPEALPTLAIPQGRPALPAWPPPPDRRLALLAPAARRIYRRGREALTRLRKKPSDERWHELGKRSKDLWYVSQLLQPVTPKQMKQVRKQAHRLSDLLGEDHELALLEQRIRGGQLSEKEVKLVRRLIGRRRRNLQDEALLLARRLYRRKPRKFARRLGLG
jgi:hypothetical protein